MYTSMLAQSNCTIFKIVLFSFCLLYSYTLFQYLWLLQQGEYYYVFADHGGLIVAVKQATFVDTLMLVPHCANLTNLQK